MKISKEHPDSSADK